MGSRLQLTVVPSDTPSKDADSFQSIFSGYVAFAETDDSVILRKGDSKVIFCKTESIGTMPSVFVVDENVDQMDGAQHQAGVQVLALTVICRDRGTPFLLRFDGGGSLIVISRQQLTVGDQDSFVRLTKWLIDPDSIGIDEEDSTNMVDISLSDNNARSKGSEHPSTPTTESSFSQVGNGSTIMTEEQVPEYVLPKFPTLEVSLPPTYSKYPVNAPVPVPFENACFKGKVLFLMRPLIPKEDPFWNERLFSRKKRRVSTKTPWRKISLPNKSSQVLLLVRSTDSGEIQTSTERRALCKSRDIGPNETWTVDEEVKERPNPDCFWTMNLSHCYFSICNILLKFLKSFSKGLHYSFGNDEGTEKPHLSVPSFEFFEAIVVTPDGNQPPSLGNVDFKKMKGCISSPCDWNTSDTYTLSWYTMYLDLPSWRMVQLPFAPSLDLRTFWGQSTLRVSAYENTTAPQDGRHLTKDNTYYFDLQIKFHGGQEADNVEANEALPWSQRTRSVSESNLRLSPVLDRSNSEVNEPLLVEDDGEEYYFYDAEDADTGETQVINRVNLTDSEEMLRNIDNVCPMWIDMCAKGNKYIKAYALNVDGGRRTIFRVSQTLADYVDVQDVAASASSRWSSRLSSCERTRRIMGEALALKMDKMSRHSGLKKLWSTTSEFDSSFLRGTPPTLPAKRARMVRMSCFVARAFSDHHWIEEWMKVTDYQLSFYHPERPTKANLQLSLQNLLSVRKLTSDEAPPMPSYHFMEVQTLGQRVYIMYISEQLVDSWVAYLSTVVRTNDPFSEMRDGTESVQSENLHGVDDPSKEFLHKSSMWNCKQRRILNCRKFVFRSSNRLSAMDQVEDTLRKALDRKTKDLDEDSLCSFLDSASTLKEVSVSKLSEEERIAFFLNLYHVMIMHAFLVLGPPDSTFKWMSYFNTIAYQCSDDIFSLTELEHNIIRGKMSYPSQFISKFVIPKSQFTFALRTVDFRINFALNCGSTSNPGFVPVYKAISLDYQLDEATSAYLKSVDVTSFKRSNVSVTLPRVCDWFAEDFGDGSSSSVLKIIERFLNEDDRALLGSCWDAEKSRYTGVTIKHHSFSFQCRSLTLIE